MDYLTYLKIPEILKLQNPLSDGPEHDETLFIIIHQVYELWFKQVLHEITYLKTQLDADNLPLAQGTLKRILTIFKTLVGQIDILETMTPLSFNSFRSRLDTSSGFQSLQFRKLEFVLGAKRPQGVTIHAGRPSDQTEMEAVYAQPSLYDHFLRFLARKGFAIPEAILKRDVKEPNPEDAQVRTILIDIYRHHPELAPLCERLVDLDEGLQEWRYRHVRMVERTIGRKVGTGGSAGAEYLKSTLFKSLFPDLWTIRSEF